MVYIDANVFVSALMDFGSKGKSARKIMELIDKECFDATTSSLTMDEVMWVFIKSGRGDKLTRAISGFYESAIRILPVNPQTPLKACDIMEKCGLDSRDAIHAAVMKENYIKDILSEDKNFDKVGWIKRYSMREFLENFS
jgi:predicted nucleic acid-binding protein